MQCWVTFKTADFLWLVDPGTACRGPIREAVQSLSPSFLGFFPFIHKLFSFTHKGWQPLCSSQEAHLR